MVVWIDIGLWHFLLYDFYRYLCVSLGKADTVRSKTNHPLSRLSSAEQPQFVRSEIKAPGMQAYRTQVKIVR